MKENSFFSKLILCFIFRYETTINDVMASDNRNWHICTTYNEKILNNPLEVGI